MNTLTLLFNTSVFLAVIANTSFAEVHLFEPADIIDDLGYSAKQAICDANIKNPSTDQKAFLYQISALLALKSHITNPAIQVTPNDMLTLMDKRVNCSQLLIS